LRSKIICRFREAFSRLPEPVEGRAREAYQRFAENPDHPGLRFKRVHPTEPIYSVRIAGGYRALGIREDDMIVCFWSGSNADYDTLNLSPIASVLAKHPETHS
jgi:hypothetical protein